MTAMLRRAWNGWKRFAFWLGNKQATLIYAVLYFVVLGPVALALGISPWVVGLIALVATNTFFLPYQSTIYLALYYGMGVSFSHADVRPVAWAYAGAVLVGIALSLPVWRAMGLLG